jgi:hypothetical protein
LVALAVTLTARWTLETEGINVFVLSRSDYRRLMKTRLRMENSEDWGLSVLRFFVPMRGGWAYTIKNQELRTKGSSGTCKNFQRWNEPRGESMRYYHLDDIEYLVLKSDGVWDWMGVEG